METREPLPIRHETPGITVVVPSYNPSPSLLRALYQSLQHQRYANFEVILVDDASTDESAYACIADPRFRRLRQERNRGPAACRNRGAVEAGSPCIFFTDTDCELAPDVLEKAVAALEGAPILAGNTVTRTTTRFGKAVALLGFPGGGCIGFDKVWRVDATGLATSFSSCNLAFRKTVFEELGRFNESFPVAGGEDTVLAALAVKAGYPIRHVRDMVVYHVEKSDLRGFVRWQITRGRGNYHIRRNVDKVSGYLRLRLWTFMNSLRAAGALYALPVLVLILVSVICQIEGMRRERSRLESADRR